MVRSNIIKFYSYIAG
uniref:Uncharacterized protein n=1 Tax=Anguilla anguilla TaxID=7936 RepID=A0A0E9XFN2_ANGAN